MLKVLLPWTNKENSFTYTRCTATGSKWAYMQHAQRCDGDVWEATILDTFGWRLGTRVEMQEWADSTLSNLFYLL